MLFSTEVTGSFQDVKVVTANGDDLAGQPNVRGKRVVVRLQKKAYGTIVVNWRTLGADGHPITGSFRYSVQKPDIPKESPESPAPEQPRVERADPQISKEQHAAIDEYPRDAIERVGIVARLVYYITLLAVVGGGIFASIIARGWRPRYFRRAVLMLIASSLTLFFTNLALAGEYSIMGVINPWNFVPHATTPVGRVALISAVLGFLLLRGYGKLKEATRTGNKNALRSFAFLVILLGVAPALGGHAIASQAPWVRVPADMLHLLAASIWFGGIVQLQGVASASYSRHPAVYPAARRFARLAFLSVITLVVTGVVAAWLEIGLDAGDLFSSTYGQLVLLKVGLLGLTIPLAKANQERHLPELETMTRKASANLRRYVAFEVMLVLAVIAVTSLLVYQTPPRHARMGHNLHPSNVR